jgi:mono/diheme cytochrome c family protein
MLKWTTGSRRGGLLLALIVGASTVASVTSQRTAAQNVPFGDDSRSITYTDEQAARGMMLFRRNCMFCHSTNSENAKSAAEPLRGFFVGPNRNVSSLGGRYVRKYPSVYHLFERIRDNMPAWDIESITPAQKVDIVAYLLKENEFPSGLLELPLDVAAMKRMRLAAPPPPREEPGFAPIFNGRDFTNLKFLIGFNCTLPPGCGRTDPTVFSVANGAILAHGRQHGYMFTEKRYLNFDLRFDYRTVAPLDRDPDDDYFAVGGGFLLFITNNKIWPICMEIEGDNVGLLRAIGVGTAPIKATYDAAALARANRGPGPWNSVEIVSSNGEVDAYLNSTLISHVSEHPFKQPGHIAFQYQGGTWYYRNLRIRADP